MPLLTLAEAERLTAWAVAPHADPAQTLQAPSLEVAANLPCCAPLGRVRVMVATLNVRAAPVTSAARLGQLGLVAEAEMWGWQQVGGDTWYLLRTPEVAGWAAAIYDGQVYLKHI